LEHLTIEELTAVLECARAHRERDHVLFTVMFWHGLRISEALSLTPQHFADGFLIVQRLKGSRKTVQKLADHPDPLLNEVALVDEWIRKHRTLHQGDGDGRRLFNLGRKEAWKLMQLYGERAGIPRQKRFCHVFKHTLASLVITHMPIHEVQKLLGHKSGASTMRYLDTTDAQAMSRAVEAIQKQSFYRPMKLAFGKESGQQ
jgi:integrase